MTSNKPIEILKDEISNFLPFWQDECRNNELLWVWVKGSFLIPELIDQKSDIDIELVNSSYSNCNPLYHGTIQNTPIHWWIQETSFSRWPADDFKNNLFLYAGLYLWKYATKESILYENPQYSGCWDIIQKYQETVSELGVALMIFFDWERFQTKTPSIHKADWILIDFWYDLQQIEKDEHFWTLIKHIKRRKWTEEEIIEIIDIRYNVYHHIITQNQTVNYRKKWLQTMESFEDEIMRLKQC